VTSCFFIKPLRAAIVYIFPQNGHDGWVTKAVEFVQSYQRHPPGLDHDTIIVCNGAPATQPSKDLFAALPNLTFLDHDNSGWDIGGFQAAARQSSADLMVFFGSHTYFRRAGWLARMQEVAENLGDTLYGATGNQGNAHHGGGVHPHVRTTAFWCRPGLFSAYPLRVTQASTGGQRYEAEHGKDCLSNWVKSQGRQPWIVGWDAVFPLDQCDSLPNGYHKGNQENLLVGDRLCCPPYYPVP
jgi:hypothetical protein